MVSFMIIATQFFTDVKWKDPSVLYNTYYHNLKCHDKKEKNSLFQL